jgi:predicted esterase
VSVHAHTIAVGTHGRYLVDSPGGSTPLLVGFHGYAESAEAQLERLRAVPGAERWRLVSVQALHRFYQRRSEDIVASWMTRQDRELAIADNVAYVLRVIEAEATGASAIVLAGFSQGVAMAFRAAAASARPVAAVIAVGGDVPPELDRAALAHIPAVLICRGQTDPLYAPATFTNDVARLRDARVTVTPFEFDGGHEWAGDMLRAASTFLQERFA